MAPDCSLINIITRAHSRQGWIVHHPQPFPGKGRWGNHHSFPSHSGLIKALLH